VKQKVALKDTKKLSRTQINGKPKDIGSFNENKYKISLQSLYLKTVKRQYIHSLIEDSEFVLLLECNNAGLKKLSKFCLNRQVTHLLPKCLLKYELNSEQHFSYFDPDYNTSGLIVIELARVYCSAILKKLLGIINQILKNIYGTIQMMSITS
jgi:hypothetical protein